MIQLTVTDSLKLILSTFISMSLFIGGIVIFLSAIPFWSLFLGIASIQCGLVFLIFTYERVSRESVFEAVKKRHEIHQFTLKKGGTENFLRAVKSI